MKKDTLGLEAWIQSAVPAALAEMPEWLRQQIDRAADREKE